DVGTRRCGDIPNEDGAILAAAGDGLAVRSECKASESAEKDVEALRFLARNKVEKRDVRGPSPRIWPVTHAAICPISAARRKGQTVGRFFIAKDNLAGIPVPSLRSAESTKLFWHRLPNDAEALVSRHGQQTRSSDINPSPELIGIALWCLGRAPTPCH